MSLSSTLQGLDQGLVEAKEKGQMILLDFCQFFHLNEANLNGRTTLHLLFYLAKLMKNLQIQLIR